MNKNKGFTLIELLVVIAIIGVLAAVILSSLNSARAKARDAKRVQEITQVNTAIELYIADNGHAPDLGDPSCLSLDTSNTNCFSDDSQASWATLASQLSPYISQLPTDPCGERCRSQASSGFVAYAQQAEQAITFNVVVYDMGKDPQETSDVINKYLSSSVDYSNRKTPFTLINYSDRKQAYNALNYINGNGSGGTKVNVEEYSGIQSDQKNFTTPLYYSYRYDAPAALVALNLNQGEFSEKTFRIFSSTLEQSHNSFGFGPGSFSSY